MDTHAPPNAYGLFWPQKKECWAKYATMVGEVLQGTVTNTIPATATLPLSRSQPHATGPAPAKRPAAADAHGTTVIGPKDIDGSTPRGCRTLSSEVPRSIESVIDQSRHIMEEGTFTAFMRFMRTHLPGVARRDEGLFTKMGVMEFQNWQLDENVKLKLTDAQILAVMRVEFPVNPGKVFTGTLNEGLKIVQGIRGEYNRDGHGGRTPADRGLPPSERYGKFAIGDHHARRSVR